jgi:hypothetical protein
VDPGDVQRKRCHAGGARDDASDDEEPVKRPTARDLEALVIPSLRIAFQQLM